MCSADAGELQELGRVDRAAAENHLAGADDLAVLELDSYRARLVEQDPRDERAAAHLEVGPSRSRVQVGAPRAHAPAAADRPVDLAEALLPVAVDIVGQLVAGLLHRLEEGAEEGSGRWTALEHDRPVAAAPLVGAGEAGLHLLEVRQAVR